MALGSTNYRKMLERVIDIIVSSVQQQLTLFCFDDIVIILRAASRHIDHFRLVFRIFETPGVNLELRGTFFLQTILILHER